MLGLPSLVREEISECNILPCYYHPLVANGGVSADMFQVLPEVRHLAERHGLALSYFGDLEEVDLRHERQEGDRVERDVLVGVMDGLKQASSDFVLVITDPNIHGTHQLMQQLRRKFVSHGLGLCQLLGERNLRV